MGSGGGRLPAVVALWRAGSDQVIAFLGQGIGRQKFELTCFVATKGQPSLIITLNEQIWSAKMLAQSA
jgi:hypothetical protein